MSSMTANTVFWRLSIAALLIVSMAGPWTFDLIHVPAQYACSKPFVRLYDDFCGDPVSGFGTFKWVAGRFSYTLGDLLKGNFSAHIPELIFMLGVLVIVLPFFSSLLLLGKRSSRRLQTINLVTWGLACLPTLAMLILQSSRGPFVRFLYLLWGLSLYILLAAGAVLFEILVLRFDTEPGEAV